MAYLPPIEAQDILICPSRWAHTNSKILQTYSNWIESTSLREDGCRLTNHPSKPKTSANSARREANKQDVSPSVRRARHTDAPWSHSVMNVPRTYHMWNTYKRWQKHHHFNILQERHTSTKRKAEIKPPDSSYRNSMLVGSVDPSRGRHCDKWMWEIHKHIDQVPVPKMVSFNSQLPLYPFVLLVASFVVMAHKQLRPLHMPTVAIPQWNWAFEELQIGAGKISSLLQLFQSGERKGNGEAPIWMWMWKRSQIWIRVCHVWSTPTNDPPKSEQPLSESKNPPPGLL